MMIMIYCNIQELYKYRLPFSPFCSKFWNKERHAKTRLLLEIILHLISWRMKSIHKPNATGATRQTHPWPSTCLIWDFLNWYKSSSYYLLGWVKEPSLGIVYPFATIVVISSVFHFSDYFFSFFIGCYYIAVSEVEWSFIRLLLYAPVRPFNVSESLSFFPCFSSQFFSLSLTF